MSEATLRRRLSAEQTRFEVLLLETRMQHAMMLVQTTSWSMQRLAEACGYKSSARFSERFKNRFGCSPTKIR
ncbi:helix-turn-helix transcriptional regulator [Pectobacterium versatile]|nr:helix-turn-helix transcriptional regulator [Pectobacterium versatile]